MRFSVLFIALGASLGAVNAFKSSSVGGIPARHLHLKRTNTNSTAKARCRKVSKSSMVSSAKVTSKATPVANVGGAPSKIKTSSKAAATATPKTTSSSNTAGTVKVSGNYCGGPGASATPEKTTGPNGSENWLNCGVDTSGGWQPPTITAAEVISKNLADVIDGNTFSPCKSFLSSFNKWGAHYNIPPIMLASFALQESSCNPYPSGGDGHGLMQITTDKCGDAPGGNCEDPDFNIMSGARYFSTVVASHNGNLVQSVGEYNGWNVGMTVAQAKEEPGGCVTQRNLDYLHQFFNGWMQNVDASNMGIYFNLNNC
jgi:hypothetical protein